VQEHAGFILPELDAEMASVLEKRASLLRGAILTMTSVAGSGHPGGSLSSLEIDLLLHTFARIDATHPRVPERDRIVISHGHTSPALYAVLGQQGYFDLDDAIAHFRQAGSPFEGHVERGLPGVEWSTGNLGQGLSAGVGFALAARITGLGWHTYVAMSDGEQNKGQVAEARRLAAKEGLVDLTVVVDMNGIQISGKTRDVMPVGVAADFAADGWGVIECDGHDVADLYRAIALAGADTERPYAVLAHTVIGKGVSFMEGDPAYHGKPLSAAEYARAMAELGLPDELEQFQELRNRPISTRSLPDEDATVHIETPTVIAPPAVDDRSAWGAALVELAESAPEVPMAVLDCDLAVSVKTDAFARIRPEAFIECGVGEHNAATVAGALSISGVLTFWSDFGVFGIDEVYNQQRLNDLNRANVQMVLTHCGIDVGEDGKTHQCFDYVGAFRNMFGWRVVVPADPLQTTAVIRALSDIGGNVALAMGRSKIPALRSLAGDLVYGENYVFRYGAVEWPRDGADVIIVAMGTVCSEAVGASDVLRGEGIDTGVALVSCPLDIDDAEARRILGARLVVVVEDHHWRTGLWATLAEKAALLGIHPARLIPLGITGFQSSGDARELYRIAGLDADGIAASVREALAAM